MTLREPLALVAASMTMGGTWLRWRLSSYCSAAEEAAKDEKITPQQARQKIDRLKRACPLLTILGLVMLLLIAISEFSGAGR